MKSSATISESSMPTKTERRGAGRATKLSTTLNSIADTLRAEGISPHAGTEIIVDRSAMPVTYSDMASSGSSEIDWTEVTKILLSESSTKLNLDENGQPENSSTWRHIIEQHLRKNCRDLNPKVLLLRKERLMLLAGLLGWKIERLARINQELYELTKNPIYYEHG